jgi:hypothetical protein
MKAKRKKNLAPTKTLAEDAFSRVPGKFGRGKLANSASVNVSPDRGEYIIESELGATRRANSSSPSSPKSSGAKPSDNPSILPAARTDGGH